VHFAGFLANANSDVLKLKLDRGFMMRQVPRDYGYALLAGLEKIKNSSIFFRSDFTPLHSDQQYYVVENTFDSWVTTAGEDDEDVVLDPEYNDAAHRTPHDQGLLNRRLHHQGNGQTRSHQHNPDKRQSSRAALQQKA